MSAPISAALVKELRERTSAAMMDCKKALQETGGERERTLAAHEPHGGKRARRPRHARAPHCAAARE